MKKIALCIIASCILSVSIPVQSSAATAVSTSVVVTKPSEMEEVKALELRLNEINAMDKSNLKSSEKKNLRKEVRSIKHQLNELGGGGVYISVGALIIIIILLIVLF